jgi:uncharacterized repeat protein (TIGR03803 family)
MNCKRFLGAAIADLVLIILVALVFAPGAWAQSKFKTLYKFTSGADGNDPLASLILDQSGDLYGTTESGGGNLSYCLDGAGCGTVFKLTSNTDGSWTESVLYTFCSLANCSDGEGPQASLIFDHAGNLYGTTVGGGAYRAGTVFKLTPNSDGRWTESVLHSFTGTDGQSPQADVIFDQAGNLYGTTSEGGNLSYCNGYGCGTVFKLAPNPDGSWTESMLHNFTGTDGLSPHARVIFDQAGNLYGTTSYGGPYQGGSVFELTPNGDGSWTEKVLHSFCRNGCRRSDGSVPYAGLIFDRMGSLYGTTEMGGASNAGTVFKLAPRSNGGWNEVQLYQFTGGNDGWFPMAGLSFDQAGHLYGTTEDGGYYGEGVVFKLAHSKSGWKEIVRHPFAKHPGGYSYAGVIVDAAGNLYGTTRTNNLTTFGTVFEITP